MAHLKTAEHAELNLNSERFHSNQQLTRWDLFQRANPPKVDGGIKLQDYTFSYGNVPVQVCHINNTSRNESSKINIYDDSKKIVFAKISLDLESIALMAEFLGLPQAAVLGATLHHELGHLEDMMARGKFEKDDTMDGEIRAWRNATGIVLTRLPQSLKGVPEHVHRQVSAFCLLTYEQ